MTKIRVGRPRTREEISRSLSAVGAFASAGAVQRSKDDTAAIQRLQKLRLRTEGVVRRAIDRAIRDLTRLTVPTPRRARARHPMQPVVVDHEGIHRFKENAIVRYMLDEGTRANHFSLNTIAMRFPQFSLEDHEQLAPLIGYSVCGACDLSYMSDRVCNAALAESAAITAAKAARKRARK